MLLNHLVASHTFHLPSRAIPEPSTSKPGSFQSLFVLVLLLFFLYVFKDNCSSSGGLAVMLPSCHYITISADK